MPSLSHGRAVRINTALQIRISLRDGSGVRYPVGPTLPQGPGGPGSAEPSEERLQAAGVQHSAQAG